MGKGIVLLFMHIIFASAYGIIDFNDGEVHTLDYLINDDVRVDFQTPNMNTALDFRNGARMTVTHVLSTYGSSMINMSGGEILEHFSATDHCTISMTNGYVGCFFANGHSQTTISGGYIDDYIYAYGNSEITIYGGYIGGDDPWRESIRVLENAQVTILGGSLDGKISVSSNAAIKLVGQNFAINGQSVPCGEYTANEYSSGVITGMFTSGYSINNEFEILTTGKIILIPEPASLLLLTLGSILAIRKKRSI